MSDDLKPCPFCGYDEIQITVDENQGTKWGRAVCFSCNAVGPEVRTGYDKSFEAPWRAEAAAEWNRRASDTEIERLRAAAKLAPNELETWRWVLPHPQAGNSDLRYLHSLAVMRDAALSPLPAPKEPK